MQPLRSLGVADSRVERKDAAYLVVGHCAAQREGCCQHARATVTWRTASVLASTWGMRSFDGCKS